MLADHSLPGDSKVLNEVFATRDHMPMPEFTNETPHAHIRSRRVWDDE